MYEITNSDKTPNYRTAISLINITLSINVGEKKGAIKNGQSRETGNIGYTRRRETKQTNTQNNMCWTPLYVNKHK